MDAAPPSVNTVPGIITQEHFSDSTTKSFFYGPEFASSNEKLLAAKSRLTTLLQSSLDLEVILELFFDELSALIELRGIEYRHEEQNLQLAIAEQDQYRCSYRLLNGQDFLGELTLYRQSAFNEYHFELIETVTGHLLFPIRNALSYRTALTASLTDPLTGAGNRTGLERHLKRELDLTRRYGTPLCLLMIDIDDFKLINDEYGHAVGDSVLVGVINTLLQANRQSDLCFRYGGEEFVVVLGKTLRAGAELIADRFRQSVQRMKVLPQHEKQVTVSIGVAECQENDDYHSLMLRSDKALYAAKRGGKNRVVTADS